MNWDRIEGNWKQVDLFASAFKEDFKESSRRAGP